MPTARSQLAVVTADDGRIYAIGGSTRLFGSVDHDVVEAYDPKANTWHTMAPLPAPRSSHGAAIGSDGRIYVVGGTTSNVPTNSMQAYDPKTNTWDTALPPLPTPRSYVGVVAGRDGRIYTIGGSIRNALNNFEVYDPETNTWTSLPPMPTARLGLGAATDTDGRIYAIGGISSSNTELGTVDVYTPGSDGGPGNWTTAIPTAPLSTPRGHLAATTGRDGRIYAIGGYKNVAKDTVEAYSPATNTWQTVTAMNVARWQLGAATAPDGRIFAIGGAGNGTGQGHTVEAYDSGTPPPDPSPPTTPSPPSFKPGAWTAVAPMSSPRTRLAAATGPDGRIYALGGHAGGSGQHISTFDPLAIVEAYDPKTNSWSTVAAMSTPRKELAATTGTDGRIYAIGGYSNNGGFLNTVEAYDPKTNTWAPVPPMPFKRSGAGAATGSDGRIYVIGGRDEISEVPDTNMAYDPKTNTWDGLVTPGGAGGEIVTAYPDGRIYSLSSVVHAYTVCSGTWSRLAERPSKLFDHAAELGPDGRMYALGGYPGGYTRSRGTVEAYTPANNSWEEVAPMVTARQGHAAATGLDGRIYAIGGQPDFIGPEGDWYTNRVEAYTPVAREWTAPSTRKPECPDLNIGKTGSVYEPQSAPPVMARLTVNLDRPAIREVKVDYATAEGSAKEGLDYTRTTGTLTFGLGEQDKTISVPVLPDGERERDETLLVNLTRPVNASLSNAQGVLTIHDSLGELAIGNQSVYEPDAGKAVVHFAVTFNGSADQGTSVDFATADRSAEAGVDYLPATGTLHFTPGDNSEEIAVTVLGDTTPEPDETFVVNLANPTNAILSQAAIGVGTIIDGGVEEAGRDPEPTPPPPGPVAGVVPGVVTPAGPHTPPGALPPAPPPPAPVPPVQVPQGQAQAQSQIQAQSQLQQQAQAQAQLQAQAQAQFQQQSQAAFSVERHREPQVELAHEGNQASKGELLATRRSPSPVQSQAPVWGVGLLALGASLLHRRRQSGRSMAQPIQARAFAGPGRTRPRKPPRRRHRPDR